jgi:hypothetical protein
MILLHKVAQMKKIGLAISTYNKIDEVETTVNIVRRHWKSNNDAFISVCCNDPNSFEKLKHFDINNLIMGDDIPSTPKPFLRCRQFDCISKSVLGCESEFVIHYHADAFTPNVEPILNLVNFMENNNKSVAYRGRGVTWKSAKNLFGDLDDHFLIFKKNEIIERNLFYCKPLKYLRACNVESLLSLLIKSKFELNEIYHYSDMVKNLVPICDATIDVDNYYDDKINHRALNPFNVDVDRNFIHAQSHQHLRKFLLEYNVPENLICF